MLSHIMNSSSNTDPLCSFSPELVNQVMISRYIAVGSLAVSWLMPANWVSGLRTTLSVGYVYQQLFILYRGFVITATIIRVRSTITTSTCGVLEKLVDTFFSTTIIFTSLLFLFRTRAVFNRNPWIVAFFSGMWLAVLGGCLAFVIGDIYSPTLGMELIFCLKIHVTNFAGPAIIIPLVNDTFVFLAITWRLFRNSGTRPVFKNGIRFLVFGDYLSAFSKALLQDGQAYYLSIIIVNIIPMVTLVPHPLRTIFSVSSVALTNIMACRVFRNIIFGHFRETEISTSVISRDLEAVIPISLREGESGGTTRDTTFNIDGTQSPKRSRSSPCS